jgi:hypothetical protein
MSWTAKITIVLLCFSLCGASTFVASTAWQKTEPQKPNLIPVKNRDLPQRSWVVAARLWPPLSRRDGNSQQRCWFVERLAATILQPSWN